MRASLATVSVAGHRETMVMKQARRHQISQRTLSNQLHASRHTIIAILPATLPADRAVIPAPDVYTLQDSLLLLLLMLLLNAIGIV